MDAEFEQRLADSVFYVDGAAHFIGFASARRGTSVLLDAARSHLFNRFNRAASGGFL